ncbi:MAG: tetratricopeptide repeat protein [Rikenellaceae bacterium]|nr:tetratricopeptide repeat protein [Rikenellaceae bacterium]
MNRIKKSLAALAVVIMGTGAAAAQDLNDVIDKYNAAAEIYSARNYVEAITALNEVVALGLEVGGDAAEIVANAQKLIPGAYYRVGGAYLQQKDYDTAIEHFGKAAELGELYGDINTARNASGWIAKAYTAMGADAFNDKDYAKAAEIFQKGYEANPSDAELALNLAKSYAEMGENDPEAARKGYEVYTSILGQTHSKYDDARAQAKEEYSYYILRDASAANAANDTQGAYDILDSYLEADPENPQVNLMYIQIATNKQQWDKVIEKGEAAAEAQTDEELKSEAYFLLGAAYQNKENKAKAIESYRKVTAGGKVATARQQINALQ